MGLLYRFFNFGFFYGGGGFVSSQYQPKYLNLISNSVIDDTRYIFIIKDITCILIYMYNIV